MIGSISEGTMRPDDLIPVFASELDARAGALIDRADIADLLDVAKDVDQMNDDQKGDLLNALFNALNDVAPPMTYFGASEDDGASYGFWPALDDVLTFADLDDVPRECWGQDIAIVNDHGNVTAGYVDANGTFHEDWSLV